MPTRDRQVREAELKQELAVLENELATLEEELRQKQPAWEESKRTGESNDPWKVLTINSAKANTQKLEVQPDGAILASGENPDHDTYTLAAETDLPRIGRIRLETLRLSRIAGELSAVGSSIRYASSFMCRSPSKRSELPRCGGARSSRR